MYEKTKISLKISLKVSSWKESLTCTFQKQKEKKTKNQDTE